MTYSRYSPAPIKDRLVAPPTATDRSRGPKTLLITAELDLSHDDGEAYGRALEDAGNAVRIQRVIGALRGFVVLRCSGPLREACQVINAFLGDNPVAGAHPVAEEPT